MYSIGDMVRKFGLSRTTLLYYEDKGLLVPARRLNSNYRIYSEADCERLALIKTYRRTGLSVEKIGDLLHNGTNDDREEILKAQLDTVTNQISVLSTQRNMLSSLLGKSDFVKSLSKEAWVELLASIGLDEAGQLKWHRHFEQQMPDAHQQFLESLNLDAEEIHRIRTASAESDS